MKYSEDSCLPKQVAFLLMCFVFLNHFFVLISFLAVGEISAIVFPFSYLMATCCCFAFVKRQNVKGLKLFLPGIIGFLVTVVSALFSLRFYDFTFDGQWYHQPAIYSLENGWNALFNPLDSRHDSIVHFPKGTWYFSSSAFRSLGLFEAAKCLNVIMMTIAALTVHTTLKDYRFSNIQSAAIAVLVILHPVVSSEITTFQNDNNLYLNLVIYITTIFSWLRTRSSLSLLMGLFAAVCLINIKFTGLAFFLVFATFGFIWLLVYRKKHILKYIGIHAVILILGVGIFGFNPYITNLIHRGHPLYPIMGTEEHPDHVSKGQDGNELYETPKNMMGKPALVRFFYANFSRPSNAPYNNQENAELTSPFTWNVSDWDVYRFHDLRIGAFGPLFNIILLLSLLYLVFLSFLLGRNKWHLWIPVLALFASLMLSKHFWWARFGPQLWLLPIGLIIASFSIAPSTLRSVFNWATISLMIINGLIVLFIHLSWVTNETRQLKKHFTEIKKSGKPIEICMFWFNESMNRKLDEWKITYKEVSMKEMKKMKNTPFKPLRTVVDGYPGTNRYRFITNTEEFPKQQK